MPRKHLADKGILFLQIFVALRNPSRCWAFLRNASWSWQTGVYSISAILYLPHPSPGYPQFSLWGISSLFEERMEYHDTLTGDKTVLEKTLLNLRGVVRARLGPLGVFNVSCEFFGPGNAAWRHHPLCISFNKSGCRSSSLRSLTNGGGGRVSPRS